MVYTQPGTKINNKDACSVGVCPPNHLVHNSIRTNPNGGFRFAMRPGDSRLQIRENVVNLGPDSLPPGGFVQDNVFFDIRLTGSGVHTLTETTLQMTVRNTNPLLLPDGVTPGTAVIPLLPFFFFRNIEVMANGSFTDDTIYPIQMYLRYCHAHLPENLKTIQSEWVGMEASTTFSRSDPRTMWNCYDEDGVAIPPSTSKQYFLPLQNFISTTSLFLPVKQQDPRIRFHLGKNPIRSDNAAADVAGTPLLLQGVQMILKGIIYEPEILLNLVEHYTSITTVMPTVVHERQVIDIKTASEGIELSDNSLSSLNGEYLGFFLWLERGSAVREELYSSNNTYTAATEGWLPLEYVSLKDSSGNPIGYNNIPGGYMKAVSMGHAFPHCFMSAMKNLYFFPFAKNQLAGLLDGLPSGGMYFDSNFTLSVTPGPITANPATTNYRLWIFGLRKAALYMSPSGLFEVRKQ